MFEDELPGLYYQEHGLNLGRQYGGKYTKDNIADAVESFARWVVYPALQEIGVTQTRDQILENITINKAMEKLMLREFYVETN